MRWKRTQDEHRDGVSQMNLGALGSIPNFAMNRRPLLLVSMIRFAQDTRRRMDEHVPLRAEFALTAAYTRMVQGFGGHPKFSKSIPGSALDMTTPAQDVRRLLTDEPPIPEQSATYQLMCQIPRYDAATLI